MEEIWKDIKGYEGIYQISNLGRCRSLDRKIVCDTLLGDADSYIHKGRVLSNRRLSHKGGYAKVRLVKDGIYKQHYVHKLVATAFLSNPDNKQYVDHIDTNKLNNNVNNLRWVTLKENSNNPKTKKHLLDRQKNQGGYLKYIFNGKSALSLCKDLGIKPTTFYRRVKELGWSIEEAIFTPLFQDLKNN